MKYQFTSVTNVVSLSSCMDEWYVFCILFFQFFQYFVSLTFSADVLRDVLMFNTCPLNSSDPLQTCFLLRLCFAS